MQNLFVPLSNLPTGRLSQIDGVSFSHLVTNHCVTRGRFMKLLRGLGAIHAAKRQMGAAASREAPTITKKLSTAFSGKEERE